MHLPRCLAPVAALFVLTVGCAPADEEASDVDTGALRADPSSVVSTFAPTVGLLDGYNPLLDRATSRCVTASPQGIVLVGDERSNFYLHAIRSSDELAKELEVDVGAASNVPTVDATAALKLVKTFKTSSSKVSFLLRSVRSYQVANSAVPSLTPAAADLARGGKPEQLVLSCGGSYVNAVRYEAQVLAILEFDAQSVEDARKIEVSLEASAPSSSVKGSAGLTSSIRTVAKSHAFRGEIVSSGFSARTESLTTDDPDAALASFDTLAGDLDRSFDADVARDRAGYFANTARVVRPIAVSQASYAAVPGAKAAPFQAVTTLLANAEKFYTKVASPHARLEQICSSQITRFLEDTKNQYRYNIVNYPELTTAEVVTIARSLAMVYCAGQPSNLNALIGELADHCLELASNGDYSGCRDDAGTDGIVLTANSVLANHDRANRIAELSAFAPTDSDGTLSVTSYRNASPACRTASMRLPTRGEARALAPMLAALKGPKGEIWLASDPTCDTPYFSVIDGKENFGCDTRLVEGLPFIGDRSAICVAQSGLYPVTPNL